ncbi:hypothetical protein H5P27_06820 [Pelagicoccus albus]|uniref:Sialate O-acetylesterase domain-containing protein n=1 Tax=Pelagicoccus albus TaxID=415222 RepID=A0A7X1E806_9BACT|nr:hypothetical protein [Pelagicoccus albus]
MNIAYFAGEGLGLGKAWVILVLAVISSCLVSANQRQALNFNSDWLLGVGKLSGMHQENFDDSRFSRDGTGGLKEGVAQAPVENIGDRELSIIEIEFYESLPNEQAFDLYLLMGQSNMAGRDLTGLSDQTISGQVLAYGYNGEWFVAKDPIHKQTGRVKPGVGPGIAFASSDAGGPSGYDDRCRALRCRWISLEALGKGWRSL